MDREITAVINGKKRARADELDSDSPELKLARVDSPAAKGIQDGDVLGGILDGPEDAAVPGLDLVMRSLEEEILAPATDVLPEGESLLPELGYLLEASDDELGIPPAGYSGGESTGFAGGFGFEEGMPSYNSFDLELVGESAVNGGDGFVALAGLFDHPEDWFGAAADVSISALQL